MKEAMWVSPLTHWIHYLQQYCSLVPWLGLLFTSFVICWASGIGRYPSIRLAEAFSCNSYLLTGNKNSPQQDNIFNNHDANCKTWIQIWPRPPFDLISNYNLIVRFVLRQGVLEICSSYTVHEYRTLVNALHCSLQVWARKPNPYVSRVHHCHT